MKKNNIMIKKIILFTTFTFSQAFSLTINVPEDFLDIQDAIDFSQDGDTIFVSPGVYFENINFNGKSILVSSNYIEDNDLSLIHI